MQTGICLFSRHEHFWCTCAHVCLHLSRLVDMMSRWKEKGTVGLYGIVAGWLLVTGFCSVLSAPVIPGNLGHFQPVRI